MLPWVKLDKVGQVNRNKKDKHEQEMKTEQQTFTNWKKHTQNFLLIAKKKWSIESGAPIAFYALLDTPP